MPRVSNQAKRMKMMALEREAKRAEREELQSDLSLRDEQSELSLGDSDGEEASQIFEEEVYDEDGDVFLDSDGVMESHSFMSKFSFTSSSSSTSISNSLNGRGSVYNFNSKRTQERRRAEQRELREAAKDTHSLQNYFQPIVPDKAPSIFEEELKKEQEKDIQEEDDWTEMKLPPEAALILIDEMNVMSNAKDLSSIISAQFEVKRATAVRAFLLEWHNKKDDFRQMQESEKIATVIYNTTTSVCYRAKMIRYWAKYFLQYGEFPLRKHGQHFKVFSWILDEDIALQCLCYIRSLDKKKRQMFTSKQFSNWVNSNIPSIQISERTARRWLHHLGLNYDDVKKSNNYVDGHEREDVLRYRKHFVQLMLGWRDRMSTFDDDKVTPPANVNGRTELVLVVHDECTFAAHDGNTFMWIEDGKPPLRPKGDGNSIMISQFLCPCHGVMTVTPEQARENGWDFTSTGAMIYIGKNRDGYWDHSLLIDQFQNRVIPLFNFLHPNKTAIFAFDNSQCHHKMAYDALKVNTLKLSDGSKANVTHRMRNGYYYDEDGEKVEQSLVLANGEHKGIKSILAERGLWRRDMKLKEAKEILRQQPDFMEQESLPWLREIAKAAGHIQTFFPKFHPELNFIERYWGLAKRYARARCGYTFEELEKIVPEALQSVPLITIRRLHNHCYRYIEAYEKGTLLPHQVEWAVKKYSSHRRVLMKDGDDLGNSPAAFPGFLTPEFMADCPK